MDETSRQARIVDDTIKEIGLYLHGEIVYTEAATGPFSVTASLAAGAGADHVYAIAKDSEYGPREDAVRETEAVATALDVCDVIEFVPRKQPNDIAQATIITNCGFVRPIDESMVASMSSPVAVPLMYEPWEFREGEIGLKSCWQRGIPVLGTNESHESVRTFEFIGHGVQKVAYECGIEVLASRFVIVGGGPIAAATTKVLERSGATVTLVAPTINGNRLEGRADYLSLDELAESRALAEADAMVLAEHHENYAIFGNSSPLDARELHQRNPSLAVIHVCGRVDVDSLESSGLLIAPRTPRPPGYLTFGADYVGPRGVAKLHAAGLRIGAELVDALRSGLDFQEATEQVGNQPFTKDFSMETKRQHGYGKI